MEGVIGYTTLFAGNFAPKGWAMCQGQILAISQNTALFSLLGTTYGGNGQTTFGLPNLQGRAVVGAGQGPGLSDYTIGETGGTAFANLTVGQMPLHSHVITVKSTPNAATSANAPSPVGNVYGVSGSKQLYGPTAAVAMQSYQGTINMGPAGGGQPFGKQRPVLALNYVICMQGVFPPRS